MTEEQLTSESSALFSELSEAELARVQAVTRIVHRKSGEVIMRQHQPAEAIYVLLRGHVRVTAIMSDQDDALGREEEMLVRLKPGDFFGELSFVTGTPPNLSVIGESDATLAEIPQAKLHELISEDAQICRKVLFAMVRTLVDRLRETSRELVLSRYFIRGS